MNTIDDSAVIEILKQCYDPEIPIDLWNLGLIYKIDILPKSNNKRDVHILMTLTTPGCTMGQHMADDIKSKLESMNNINEAIVEVTFDPPWEPEMMTNEARIKLGFSKEDSSNRQGDWE